MSTEFLIFLGIVAVFAGLSYLATCANAEQWLTLREWWGLSK